MVQVVSTIMALWLLLTCLVFAGWSNESSLSGQVTGLIPLTELGLLDYVGQVGGLYGDGLNSPPEQLQSAAETVVMSIEPLDPNGRPAPDGKIGLISLGMSNTTQEFSRFKAIADLDPDRSASLVIVDCAQGGQDAAAWAHPDLNRDRTPWLVMDRRLEQAGVSPSQVQVVWIKQALKSPASFGAFPAHAEALRDDLVLILQMLKARFPNLRLAYLSSRIYGGYATTALNPEPYAYESAFAVRWVIEAQLAGDPNLCYDPRFGDVLAPLCLWGPYLWADGIRPRLSDGLIWLRQDFAADGTHPSEGGRLKVAQLLLAFFKQDPTSRPWFVGIPCPTPCR